MGSDGRFIHPPAIPRAGKQKMRNSRPHQSAGCRSRVTLAEKLMANQPPFEIPAELRDMAERNVEQARAAYGHFMDFLSQSIGAWAGAQPADEMTGFRSL